VDRDASPLSLGPIAKSAEKRIKRVKYEPELTLEAARARYFEANGFPLDGGYDSKWVDFELGPIPMPFPNTEARRRAVKVHDLHHVLTGYQTDIFGEGEISAWELAAGCKGAVAAWILNAGGMAFGVLIAPKRTWRAWLRGRSSRSLYDRPFGRELLAQRVGDVQRELGIPPKNAESKATPLDVVTFIAMWQLGAWGSLALMPLAITSAAVAATMGLGRKLWARPTSG